MAKSWKSHGDAALIGELRAALTAPPAPVALFLAGSHGRGTTDAHSDIDLLALAPGECHEALTARMLACLSDGPGLAFSQTLFHGRLTNAVTLGWRRIDLLLALPDGIGRRAQDTITPLHDPGGLWQGLPRTLPPASPEPDRVARLTNEFLRVLGLLHVGAGREEYVLLLKSLQLLRDMLTDLMLEEVTTPDKGGALHLSRLLPARDNATLETLPVPPLERRALIEAHGAVAEAFLPRARALHERLGLTWPEAFETATREVLLRSLGLSIR